LWLSFRAGNLKKMNKKSDPSKKPDTRARMRMLRSRRMVRRAEVGAGAGVASSCWSRPSVSDALRLLDP